MAEDDKSVLREGEMKNFSVDPKSTVREGELISTDLTKRQEIMKLLDPKSVVREGEEQSIMMTPEEQIILESLIKSGISTDTALDIMASNKVDSMNKLQQLRGETSEPVKPQEFGALKQIDPRSVVREGEMRNMRPPTQGAMSQQDMMNYLASKANSTKGAMGNILGAMGGAIGVATPMMQPQMRPTTGMASTGMQQPMIPTPNPMMRK